MVAAAIGPIYLDSSALVTLYLPESNSPELNALVADRSDVLVSELGITEMASALGRRCREGSLKLDEARSAHEQILLHSAIGLFSTVELLPRTHREAERLLLEAGLPLRGMDALHLALAVAGGARTLVSFDRRQRIPAATGAGLALYPGEF